MRLLKLELKVKQAILFVFSIFPVIIFAQGKKISGIVSDDTGKPIAGASVLVKKGRVGTTTSNEGLFSITADVDDVLIFSAVNYTANEIVVGNQTVIDVQLSSSQADLADVVVVGYGTQKKANLTGAVSQVGSKQIESRPVTNALGALQGLAPGLVITRSSGTPGKEGWDANIRGFSSVNGKNTPLVIIDGTPGTLSTLNPNDIESISVLKDAAAAAIYGAESSDGVLVITTKAAKSSKLKLEISSLFTANTPANKPERNPSWVEAEQLNLARNNAGQNNSWSEAEIRWFKNEDTNYLPHPTNSAQWRTFENIDYIKLMLRKYTGSQQHNVSISGRQGKSSYMFSAGYYTQNGVFKFGPDSYKRINIRLNAHTQFNDMFSFSSKISFTNQDVLSPPGNTENDYGLLYNLYQTRSIYPVFLPRNDASTAGHYDSTKYYTAGPSTYAYLLEGGSSTSRTNRFEPVFTLKMENIIKGFTFRAVYGPRFIYDRDKTFFRSYQRFDRNATVDVNTPNYIRKADFFTTTQNLQLLADYDFVIKDKHNFHILAGTQYDHKTEDVITAQAINLISNEVASLNTSSNPAVNIPIVGDAVGEKVLISEFIRLNYNYSSKYLFEATYRNDASSQLAPGYRQNSFYAFSAGWNLHSENWFKNTFEFFNELKLRASSGVLGNSSVSGYYDYIALLSRGPVYPFNNVVNNAIFQGRNVSPKKGWERVKTHNIGVDIRLLKNRLAISFDKFQRYNNNMLVSPSLPATFALTPSQQNAASLASSGFEVEVKWNDKVGDIAYFIQANLSDTKNRLTSYGGRSVIGAGVNRLIEGFPINTIWGYRTGGLFKDSVGVSTSAKQDNRTGPGDIIYIDQNKDNIINIGKGSVADHGDLVQLGETTPHYSFGTTLGLSWKGFDFSVFFQGVLNRSMLIYANAALPYMESWRQSWVIQNDYWRPDNLYARFPRLYLGGTHNATPSDWWVQKSSYIRLKNLQVGYTMPVDWVQKLKMSSVKVFLTGQDLWENTGMWFSYYDPEQPHNSSFGYPFFRSMALGLNITF